MGARLEGKVCVITGTGGSIGSAAAHLFAREGSARRWVRHQSGRRRGRDGGVTASGGTMVSLQPCNLTEPSQCQALVNLAIERFGQIDVLYNNAAKAYFNWVEDVSDVEWRATLDEELSLVFYLTRAAWHTSGSRVA